MDGKRRGMTLSVVTILAISFLYAFARYVVLGPVSPDHIPVFLLNKSVSAASVIFLFRAALCHAFWQPERVRSWGAVALHCGYLHVLLSLTILSSAYYPTFFEGARMSLRGELAVCFGVLASYGFWLIRRNKSIPATKRILQVFSTLALGGHLIAVGSHGWLDTAGWYGALPPITLISFLVALGGFLLFLPNRPPVNSTSGDTPDS